MEKLSSNIAHTHCTFTRAASLPGHVSTSHTRSSAHRSASWFSSAPSALTYAPHRSSEGRAGQARRPPGSTAGCSRLSAADERLLPQRRSAAPRSLSRPQPSAPPAPSPPLPTTLPVPGPGGPPPPHHLRSRSRMSLSCRQGKAFWGRGRNAKPAAPRRSPADILQRRRGGCHGDGAARGAQPPAPAAGLGPVTSVPPRACLPSS